MNTILLNRAVLEPLLTLDDCISAVDDAFRAHGEGRVEPPGLLHAETPKGEFHIKAGVMSLGQPFFAIKINGGFFGNRVNYQMPNIQGLVLLCDGNHGYPLALMDSKAITVKRTGAATAVAAKYLARPESSVATICGCGTQGAIQLEALLRLFPLRKVHAHSRSAASMERFSQECSARFGVAVTPAPDLEAALADTDICVTCTPAKGAFVKQAWVRPGTFVAAVGADSPDKQELDPALLQGNKVVADILDQCLHVGEIHHGVSGGFLTAEGVHAELGQIIAGLRPGRTSPDEITIFDSTGTALQDLAAAMVVYRKVSAGGTYPTFDFFAA
ncbi:MAG: ornithine cyclodeaminase family protein [Bryobacteraceae bacterium]|nr:ornithine cyclodeaminase family protein [Bryobacteraceae bacterium]